MAEEIAFLPATRLVELYRSRQLSPVEVIEESLRRLERYESATNAFVLYDPHTAMAMARASEGRWQRGEPQGLLDGVLVALKDTVLAKGWPRRIGSRTIDPKQDWHEDSPITARLRSEGAVFFGKTTTPEFVEAGDRLAAFRSHAEPMGSCPHARRQQRRERRCGIGRHLSARSRQRRPRFGPYPSCLLRDSRTEANLRSCGGLSAIGIRRCRPYGADDAHG